MSKYPTLSFSTCQVHAVTSVESDTFTTFGCRVGSDRGAEELNWRYASNPEKDNLVNGSKDLGSSGDNLFLVAVAGLIGYRIGQ